MLLSNLSCRAKLNSGGCDLAAVQETKAFRDDYAACPRKLAGALILPNQDWTTNRLLSDTQG